MSRRTVTYLKTVKTTASRGLRSPARFGMAASTRLSDSISRIAEGLAVQDFRATSGSRASLATGVHACRPRWTRSASTRWSATTNGLIEPHGTRSNMLFGQEVPNATLLEITQARCVCWHFNSRERVNVRSCARALVRSCTRALVRSCARALVRSCAALQFPVRCPLTGNSKLCLDRAQISHHLFLRARHRVVPPPHRFMHH